MLCNVLLIVISYFPN